MTTITATHKLCASCQNWRHLDNFSIRRDRPDGLQSYCKDCAYDAAIKSTARRRARKRYRPGYAYYKGVEYEPIFTHPFGFTPAATRAGIRMARPEYERPPF